MTPKEERWHSKKNLIKKPRILSGCRIAVYLKGITVLTYSSYIELAYLEINVSNMRHEVKSHVSSKKYSHHLSIPIARLQFFLVTRQPTKKVSQP